MSNYDETDYQGVKETWTKGEFDILRLKPDEAFFSRNNGVREGLLTILEKIHFNETSALEIGCLYDPLFLFDQQKSIRRLHLSDVMYASASPFPSSKYRGIQITQDSKGMPELLSIFDGLKLGNTVLVLENVMNYLDRDDVLALLQMNGRSCVQRIVVGNDFNAKIDTVHFNRFTSKAEYIDEVAQLGFLPQVVRSWDTTFVSVLSRGM